MHENTETLSYEEILRLFKETDLKFKETDLKFQETDRKFQEVQRFITEKFRETDRLIKQTQKAIGELRNRLGQFVEKMVKPAVVRLFRQRGINVHRVISKMEANYGDEGIQMDLLLIDGSEAIVVECKSSLSVDDVNEHLDRLGKFKRFWPEYGGFNLFGAVAGMVVPDDVSRYAYRQGLYVLVQNGDIVEIRNDDKFQPKVW